MNKLIFVSGGVCSSLGKGVAASSMGALLESRGLNVRMVKCDPYINVNAGTMNPVEHGEVYVTDDGAETDLDLGNYARFTSGTLSQANSITTGQVYDAVLRKEREGRYQGRCVQVIPHITDEIKARIMAVIKDDPDTDIAIVEIGGTVGDIEAIPFLEAARQLIHEYGRNNALSVHLTLIPEIGDGELKTKPTQHSVKAMQEQGIQPDILICRAPVMLDADTRRKIAQFTNIENDAVFTSCNVKTSIYEIPLMFYEQKLDLVALKKLGIEARHANIKPWKAVMERSAARKGKVRIGIVGNSVEFPDVYKSVFEALFHAGLECGVEVEPVRIDAALLENSGAAESILGAGASSGGVDGVLVPGGSGGTGAKGMIEAAAWARKNGVPFFGIGLGMQIMAVEWGKNALGWEDADSAEWCKNPGRAVIELPEDPAKGKHAPADAAPRAAPSVQVKYKSSGSALRLGKYVSALEPGTKISAAFKEKTVAGRHRHSYELSNRYRDEMVRAGLVIGAVSQEKDFADCVEWPDHPWGVGVQFHPEFKSKPTAASPLFRDFIAAARDLCAEGRGAGS